MAHIILISNPLSNYWLESNSVFNAMALYSKGSLDISLLDLRK